jgi:hypothetical protein
VLPRVSGWLTAAAVLAAVSACSSTSADEATVPSSPSGSSSGSSATPSPTASSPAIMGADGGPVVPSPGTGTLGPGFVTPTAPPPPGGTMTPSPGSWDRVTVPAGYTVALLSTDDSAPARHLTSAVKAWATANHVTLTQVPAHDPATYLAAIEKAIDLHADLVISAGDPLADPLAVVTASWPDQKFLLLGAELAEPTFNVTAAVWKGTTARGGGSGTGNAWTYDPSTFTVERAERALDAGVAAVLRGYAGFVVRVD